MSPSDKASRPRTGRRWLWLGPLLVLAVPLWLVALLALFLETGVGKRTAAGLLEDALSQPGQQVKVGTLAGSFFGELRIDRVTFSDQAGVWLELDNALLHWNPAGLFRGRLAIERLSADRLALQHLPPPGPERPPDDGPLLPDLPVEIEAKAIAIDRIELGEAVAGEAATLSLDGALLIARQRADLDLAVTRRDAGGFISANIAWEPATNVLHLSLQGQEPAGGVVARLAQLPDLPSLDVALEGAGTLADWKGQLRLALGGEDALSADIALSGDATQSLSLRGRMTGAGTLLAERLSGIEALTAWAPGGLDLSVAASRDGDDVTVSQLMLASSVFRLEGKGALAGEAVQGSATLSLADGRPLSSFLPELALGSGDFAVTVSGTLDQPNATLTFDARNLAYDTASFDQAKGTVTARGLKGGAFDLSLSLQAVRPTVDDPSLAWVWGDADLAAEATLGADSSIELRRVDLTAQDLKLAWTGDLDVGADGSVVLSDTAVHSLNLDGRLPGEVIALAEQLSGVEGLAAWAPDGATVTAVATRTGDNISVSQLSLESTVLRFDGSGSLAGEALQGSGKLSLADGRPLSQLVPDLTLGSGDFAVTASGTLDQPSATLTFDARTLAYDAAAFDRAQGTVTAKGLDDGAFDIDLALHAVRPQVDDPTLAWVWGDADLAASATLGADGSIELRRVDLQAQDLKLAWTGELAMDAEGAVALSDAAPQSLNLDGRVPAEIIALAERLSGVEGLAAWAPDGAAVAAVATRAGGKTDVSRFSVGTSVFTLSGSGVLDGEAVRGKAALSIADGRPLSFFVPELALASGDFAVTVDGTLSQPRATLDFDAARIAYDFASFDQAKGRVTATGLGEDAFDLALTLHAGNPQLAAPAPAWTWGDGDLSAEGRIDAAGAFELKKLNLDARGMKIAWDGLLNTDSLAADGHLLVDGRLPELPQVQGAVLDLELDATVQSDDLTKAAKATLAGHLQGTGELPPQAADLLRVGIDFAGGVELGEDGTLKLSAASVQSRDLSVDIDGSMKDRDLDFTFRVAAANLAPLLTPLGTDAAGALTLEGRLAGDEKAGYSASVNVDGRDLVVSGESIGALTGKLDLNNFPKAPHGELALSAPATAYGPMKVSASVTPQDSGGFLLDPLSVELGSTLQLAGKLESAAGGLPLSGTLSGSVQGSPLLAELAGLDLKGRGALQLKLSAPNGRQDAEIALDLGPGELFGTAHRGLRVTGSGQDLLGTPRLDVQANGTGVALGSTVVDSLKATAKGALNALDVTVVASGKSDGEPISVDLAAQVDALAASPPIRLTRLQGQAMAQDFKLLQPTTLRVGDTMQLDTTKLQVGETTVTVALSDKPGERKLTASFDPIKAELLAAFLPDYEPTGALSATLVLTDRGSGATGTIELKGKDLLLRQKGLSVAPAIDIAGTAKLGGGSLATSINLSGSFGDNLVIEATVPFRLSLYTFDVAVPSDGKLAGRASWKGDIGQLVDFLPLDNQVLRGQLTVDIALAGTLSQPQVQGQVALKKGHYENLVYGTLLKSLTIQMTGEGDRLVLQEASASDGRGGTVTLSGSVDLNPLAMNLQLTMRKFAVVQRDDLFAAFNGDLTLGPKGGREQVLAGTVTSDEVRLDVAARLPNTVTTLDVVVLQDGKPLGPARENAGDGANWSEQDAPLPFELGLDIKVDLPNKIYVHGSGLESEWGGNLRITGTTNQPIIRGQLHPKRGQFDALGKAFVLQDSQITFDGGPTVDPILAIKATADSGGITAIVEVSGRASAPEIHFTSNPVLPEDEVLSRVLFGRGTGKLSALEAVQLAEALAIFSGAQKSQVGMVDRMRAALGLDVLRFEAGDTDDDIGVITAGEYITKDVFVGVSQGTTAGSTAAKVEYQATDDIVIEGQAGQSSSVGVRWQWDY